MNKQQKNFFLSMLLIAFFIVIILLGAYFYIQKNHPGLISSKDNVNKYESLEQMLNEQRTNAFNQTENNHTLTTPAEQSPPVFEKDATEPQTSDEHISYAKTIQNLGYQKKDNPDNDSIDLETNLGIISFNWDSLPMTAQAQLDAIKPGQCILIETPSSLSYYQWHNFITFNKEDEYFVTATDCPK